jgi:hypothetical protein
MRLLVAARWSLVGIAAFGIALSVQGCGRKTPVRPPEAVAPETIRDLKAVNMLEGIRLTWGRPDEASDGTPLFDLDGFRVERSSAGGPFGTIGRVSVTDRSRLRQRRQFLFTDRLSANGETYQYRVVSFTADGYESEPSNVAEVTRVKPETPSVAPMGPPDQ